MERFKFVMFCAACGAVMGGFWGSALYWFMGKPGLVLGLALFGFTFLILVNKGWLADEEDGKNLDVATLSEDSV
jgi:hypothetical protein